MYEIFEKLCEEKGVTPYRVCKETGITTATISNWKAGRYTPKQDKLQKIAEFLGVTIEYLMTGENPNVATISNIFPIELKRFPMLGEIACGKPRQKDPKSWNGYRTIPIPDIIFPAIRDYVENLRSQGKTYLFTTKRGEPATLSAYRRMWGRIIESMQKAATEPITGLTAHIFRHNYCTMLCYQIPRISIKMIAYLLGDTEKMVLEVYNHIVDQKEDAAGAVNAAVI